MSWLIPRCPPCEMIAIVYIDSELLVIRVALGGYDMTLAPSRSVTCGFGRQDRRITDPARARTPRTSSGLQKPPGLSAEGFFLRVR
jgi:predicted Zn-ribbon and HTH transcriptional regulator